jgi:hypothetical protein
MPMYLRKLLLFSRSKHIVRNFEGAKTFLTPKLLFTTLTRGKKKFLALSKCPIICFARKKNLPHFRISGTLIVKPKNVERRRKGDQPASYVEYHPEMSYCEISKEMSSLYIGLDVFCQFEAGVPETGTGEGAL